MSYPMTRNGYDALEDELRDLKTVQRLEVIEAIAVAREHGDLKENAEYHAAREQQSFIEGRILELESIISHAKIMDLDKIDGDDKILFGAIIEIVNEDTDEESTYQIVGEFEADLTKGRISNTSPIGSTLMGKEVGDSIEVHTPGGNKYYEILSVKYGE